MGHKEPRGDRSHQDVTPVTGMGHEAPGWGTRGQDGTQDGTQSTEMGQKALGAYKGWDTALRQDTRCWDGP